MFIKGIVVLLENGHTLARLEVYMTGGWVCISCKDFEKGRFTGSIGTNYSITVSWSKGYIDFIK